MIQVGLGFETQMGQPCDSAVSLNISPGGPRKVPVGHGKEHCHLARYLGHSCSCGRGQGIISRCSWVIRPSLSSRTMTELSQL